MSSRARKWLAIIVAFLVVRFCIISLYRVPTPSMEPTIKVGDIVVVYRLAYALKIPFSDRIIYSFHDAQRGDIVAFHHPEERNVTMIKRVVGIGGDLVLLRDGILSINGQEQSRSGPEQDRTILEDIGDLKDMKLLYRENLGSRDHWILRNNSSAAMMPRDWPHDGTPFKVPDGSLLFFGDNRDNSLDSRGWGVVPLELVQGKAYAVAVSFYRDLLGHWHWRWARMFSTLDSYVK